MKIMKIFGLVVAVHAAVFMLIFAIPGCRSSARQSAVVTAEPAPAGTMVAYSTAPSNPTLSGNDLNPAISPSPTFDPNAQATGSGGIRFSPTRPGVAAEVMIAPPPAEPAPAVTYTVVKGDSLWTVSKRHGVTVAELAAANNLMTNAMLQLDQKLIIPQKSVAPAVSSAAGANTVAAMAEGPSYTVKAGDTLGAIARRNSTTVAALRAANQLSGDIVRPGQVLMLPVGATAPASTTENASTAPAAATRSANSVTHTIAPGETLSEIARRYGVRYAEIATANNITDPTRVRPGQELIIPGWQAPGGSAAATTPAPASAAPAATNASSAPILLIPGAADDLPPAPATDIPVIRVDEPGSGSADSGAPRIN